MLTDSRKLRIIQAVLNTQDEDVLFELEHIISRYPQKKKKPNAFDFLGTISKEDAELMNKAIEEGCGQVHPDAWK